VVQAKITQHDVEEIEMNKFLFEERMKLRTEEDAIINSTQCLDENDSEKLNSTCMYFENVSLLGSPRDGNNYFLQVKGRTQTVRIKFDVICIALLLLLIRYLSKA
jgi:hypothetical protein